MSSLPKRVVTVVTGRTGSVIIKISLYYGEGVYI